MVKKAAHHAYVATRITPNFDTSPEWPKGGLINLYTSYNEPPREVALINIYK